MERLERDSFIVLLHAYTLSARGAGGAVSDTRLADDLGMARGAVAPFIERLLWEGYLASPGPGHQLAITRQGVDYVERGARRRRSLRFDAGSRPWPWGR